MEAPKAYVPVHALRKEDLQSMINIAGNPSKIKQTDRKLDYHHGRRTMLHFLLSIFNTRDTRVLDLIKSCQPSINEADARTMYDWLKTVREPYRDQYRDGFSNDYWELSRDKNRPGPTRSLEYIKKYRNHGFKTEELKIYWNYQEILALSEDDHFNKQTDTDTHNALLSSPVSQRQNSGEIIFKRTGIETAVFEVPEGKQVIVLDFADERMPGGYFLENALTQEEVILYNSDAYRAILDLKYKMMDGGYMLPEYGVAYIKNTVFFQSSHEKIVKERKADLIVAACYDLSGTGEGLHKPPPRERPDELYERTLKKFQAIIASAVANTEGNGSNTYLLLGPIGTGAFGNKEETIAELFRNVLNEKLMGSEKAIKYAFDQIWFVSVDDLTVFKKKFE